jgi:hypothetical protein
MFSSCIVVFSLFPQYKLLCCILFLTFLIKTEVLGFNYSISWVAQCYIRERTAGFEAIFSLGGQEAVVEKEKRRKRFK